MKRATRVGFWLVVVGTVLFGGMVATGPTGGCKSAVVRDTSAHFRGISELEVHYTLLGKTCYAEIEYLLGFVGFALAIFGALLWSASKLTAERKSKVGSRN